MTLEITIPEGWGIKKLGDICTIKTGRKDANEGNPSGKFRFYTCAREYSFIDDYLFDDEAILISGNGAYTGYIHYYKGKFDAYQRTYILTDFSVDVFYLKHFLEQKLKEKINRERQDTATPYIKKGTLYKFRVLAPENPIEQHAIAAILSKVDEAIQATKETIAKGERLKKALMQNLLTGKLRPDGTWRKEEDFYTDEKFGKVPKGWKVDRFKNFAVLQRGKDLTDNEVIPGPYPVVKSNGVQIHHNQFICEPPGVVTGRSGTIGKVFYIEENYWPHNTSLYIKDFKGNNEKYIFYLINTMKFEQYYAGTTVPTLNRNDIHKVRVAVPESKDEQLKIVNFLDKADNILSYKQTKIQTLERLKKALMQNLLTRKVRVKI